MKKFVNKKAFTLTEIMIVLVILGVLALVLIPTIKNMMPDDRIIKYKKAYYTLQEIVNDIVNDPDTCQTDVEDSFNNPLKYCSKVVGGVTPRTLGEEVCNRLATVQGTICTDNNPKETTNGMIWTIPQQNLDLTYTSQNVNVDLGGGAGSYTITVNSNGKLSPAAADAHFLTDDPTK